MRMLKMLPVLMIATLALVACGKKNASTSGTSTTTSSSTPYPIVSGDFTSQCQMRGGQVYGSVCAVPLSYQPSSGFLFSTNYYWSVQQGEGVVVQGSGSAHVYVGGNEIPLNSRSGNYSGTLKITTSGNHTLQVWRVQCQNTSFQPVSCAGF